MPPKRSYSRPRRSGPPQGDDDDVDDDGDDDGNDGAPQPSEDAPTYLNQGFFSTDVYKLTVQAVSPPTCPPGQLRNTTPCTKANKCYLIGCQGSFLCPDLKHVSLLASQNASGPLHSKVVQVVIRISFCTRNGPLNLPPHDL